MWFSWFPQFPQFPGWIFGCNLLVSTSIRHYYWHILGYFPIERIHCTCTVSISPSPSLSRALLHLKMKFLEIIFCLSVFFPQICSNQLWHRLSLLYKLSKNRRRRIWRYLGINERRFYDVVCLFSSHMDCILYRATFW